MILNGKNIFSFPMKIN